MRTLYITEHTLDMYSVLFRQRSKQLAIIAILWFVFVSIVTASVTLVSCLIFQSILQCSLHSISQPPHIRYYKWTETKDRLSKDREIGRRRWSGPTKFDTWQILRAGPIFYKIRCVYM